MVAFLGDACYRDIFRARALLNHAKGTLPEAEAALEAGGLEGTVTDGQDMTAEIVLTSLPMSSIMLPIWQDVLAGPGGVGFTVRTA